MVQGTTMPINAVEMTGIVLAKFTKRVNLRHFFCREGLSFAPCGNHAGFCLR
jgi:hypothetical protein